MPWKAYFVLYVLKDNYIIKYSTGGHNDKIVAELISNKLLSVDNNFFSKYLKFYLKILNI